MNIREQALALYTAPFNYNRGYIWDSTGKMVSDEVAVDIVNRVRGWGYISKYENPEQLQDEVGKIIAEALNAFYETEEEMRLRFERVNRARFDVTRGIANYETGEEGYSHPDTYFAFEWFKEGAKR